jgi:hypothetical protein
MVYRLIGKVVVKALVFFIGRRYARVLRIGVGVAAVGVGIAAYLASRNVPEG